MPASFPGGKNANRPKGRGMAFVRQSLFLAACLAALALVNCGAVLAGGPPSWWARAQKIADNDHYGLISIEALKKLYESKRQIIILDVRTAPEFKQGHLPRARNLEFNFADQARLTPRKQAAFKALLGAAPQKLIIIYDRSLQCVRSGIAAKWAAILGYRNVKRYVEGWHGWAKANAAKSPAPKGLTLGDSFPNPVLTILPGGDDRKYLGLAPGAKKFSLGDLKGKLVLVALFHEFCLSCHEQLEILSKLRIRLEGKKEFSRPLVMLGLGAGSNNRQVVKFRRKQRIAMPLFADPESRLFHELGDPLLPALYLLEVKEGHGPTLISDFCGGKISVDEIIKRIHHALGG